MRIIGLCAALIVASVLAAGGCKPPSSDSDAASKRVSIALIAKSRSNDVFQAAYAGAKDAARELGPKYGVEVEILWLTPEGEDAAKQAEFIETAVRQGAKGIAISCSDAQTVTTPINDAVAKGVAVMCFDSDASASRRMCYYGTEDITCGKRVIEELAAAMGSKGNFGILAGNEAAPNLQNRVKGVREGAKQFPNMKEVGVYYHPETPGDAAQKLADAHRTANPPIDGWALVGGWPLFTENALPWPPGQIKVVSVDALPKQLGYLESGHVEVLLAQDCYGWGSRSVEILLDKIVHGQNPPQERIIDPLTRVTKQNAAEWATKWNKWLGR
jgi:ribose transport system substrate-binding protein